MDQEEENEKLKVRNAELKMGNGKWEKERENEIKMGNRGSGKWPMVNGKLGMAKGERRRADSERKNCQQEKFSSGTFYVTRTVTWTHYMQARVAPRLL